MAQHSDFAGWITIDGTKIDYPVMLTPNDGDYYLKRNVNGEDDINGTLFMDPRTDLVQRSTNIIIYGHNMKSGAMFGSLKKYLDEDYWREHAQIRFDTIYEKGTYEVFAVCRQRCSTEIHRNFVIMILYRRIPRRRLTTTSIISYNSRCLPEQICRSTGTSYSPCRPVTILQKTEDCFWWRRNAGKQSKSVGSRVRFTGGLRRNKG